MESVIVSAYMMTWPVAVARGAADGLDEASVSLRRKPSLSASRIATSVTSGHVETLAQQVDADEHIEDIAQTQIAR